MRRAFLLLLLLRFSLTTWAQESPLRDFDPDTIRTLYFDYASGSESIMVYSDYDGAALQIVVDSLGGYEDRMTDFRTKRVLFTVKHEAAGKHAVLLMYYPNGALRLSARFLEDTTAGLPAAFFVPSFRRPLSAYALLDGIMNTFYPDGTARQQALYRLGIRVSSQCYDFKRRPVACNDNPLIIPARLPKELYSGQSFKYDAKALGREFHVIESQARYCCGPNYELQRLQISLPKNKLSSESLACVRQGTVVPISFAVVRKYSGRNFTGNKSSSCNYELGSIAIGAGSLFYQGPKQMLEPAMIDGEKATTYFLLPIEFKLK